MCPSIYTGSMKGVQEGYAWILTFAVVVNCDMRAPVFRDVGEVSGAAETISLLDYQHPIAV